MASSSSTVETIPFIDSLVQLDYLGSIPPNTYFHRNRDGHFIATADSAARVPGAQSVANAYKRRDPAATADEIAELSRNLLAEIHSHTAAALESKDDVLTRITFRQLIFVSQRINLAIRGHAEGGGLGGAPKTYEKFPEAKATLERAIEEMKEGAAAAVKQLRDQLPEKELLSDETLDSLTTYSINPDKKPVCPEEQYTDAEWEAAIKHSADLRSESIDMMKYYGRYSVGLSYNQIRSYVSSFSGEKDTGWDWMNKIGHFENGDLYLSALPIVSRGTDSLEEMKEKNIGAVLSITEVFEVLSKGVYTSPIKPEKYAEEGIKHLQIPTPDCETIFFELVLRGVEFLHWCLSKGINVDVHCKAGRGRSFLIICCYLIKYYNMTAEAAFEHVQLMRPQSGFSKDRAEWTTLKLFEKFYYKPSK